MTVAFLGLGVMGSGMAARLVATGSSVVVWNRRRERAEPIVAPMIRLYRSGSGNWSRMTCTYWSTSAKRPSSIASRAATA